MRKFSTTVDIIGVNPFVQIPDEILHLLFKDAGKEKSPIPVKGTLQGKPFKQTVVKFQGVWRLYLNTPMRVASKTDVGDNVTFEIAFDPAPRTVPTPKLFAEVLANNKKAKEAFDKLPSYRQKEILRYLGNLKNEETLKQNIQKTLQFLLGKKVKGVLFY